MIVKYEAKINVFICKFSFTSRGIVSGRLHFSTHTTGYILDCGPGIWDTSAPGQFGTKTLRHQTTGAKVSGHFGTNFLLVPNCLTVISNWCRTV